MLMSEVPLLFSPEHAGCTVDAEPGSRLGLGRRLARIGHSWMALKTWVKFWLFFLNAVLLAAFAFIPDPLAVATLASLPLTFVLLMAFALRMGGLNRLMGIGHLIPWLPLLGYLDLRLTSDIAGPRIDPVADPALFAWALVLGVSLAVCLALDASDVVRWLRGERYVLGTKEAGMAGASKLSGALA